MNSNLDERAFLSAERMSRFLFMFFFFLLDDGLR